MSKSKTEFIGIFGGTFDPVHKGHTEIIKNLFELIPLDKVIVIPNGIPPHRKASVSSEERLRMVSSAFKSSENVVIDNREIKKKDPSYAISTLRELIEENPEHSLVWIMGSDAFAEIDSWYQWEDFIKMINISYKSRFFRDDYKPLDDERGFSNVFYQEYQFQKTFNRDYGHIVSTSGLCSNYIKGDYDEIYGDGGTSKIKQMFSVSNQI